MATYIVRVSDEEQGYADEWIVGGFRTRAKAEEFAARVEKRIINPDLGVHVNRVNEPRMEWLRSEGLFESGWRDA